MKIEKFRIKNYRSIQDSGDCYLSPKITVLAGKNEAGKTSILEALRDFSVGESLEDDTPPINRDADPQIRVTFSLNQEDLDQILPKGSNSTNQALIEVIKDYGEGYRLEENISNQIPKVIENKGELAQEIRSNIIKRGKEVLSNSQANPSLDDSSSLKDELNSLKSSLRKAERDNKMPKQEAKDLIDEISEAISKWEKYEKPESHILEQIKSKIPEFVLFSTYADQIPNEIHFNDLHNNNFAADLAEVSNLDRDLLKENGKKRDKREHKKEINVDLNEDYEEFWTQDETTLFIDWDSPNLQFWIEEDGTPYEPKLRSRGKMWHLSFYIKLTAHASRESTPVVLIDDPGLHLHAKAQKDILNKLEAVAETSRVLYTTHSPYLIDSEKLDRVWLVEKDKEEGTKIEKLHAGADEDTLRPVITAIGANTTLGVHTDKENSVVVEGISDYHYLQAFSEITNWDSDLDIIPGTGGDSPVNIGSILFGWGVEPIFLLDDDWQGGDNRDKLEGDLDIDEDRIIQIPAEDGDIEDVFTKEDFREYVLQDEEPPEYESSNSEYLKPNRGDKDKVLLAKKFYEKARNDELDLDEQTKQNIQEIFSGLDEVVE